ncbi:MAG TPA: carboxymuconolactone decarboxylase family protein [Gemmatimonadales bacterium]
MQSRIKSPVQTIPGSLEALRKLNDGAMQTGVPATTLLLVAIRASQINSCSVCTDMHTRELRQLGENETRLNMIAAWREAPYFTDAERAVLALTEAATRIADRPDAVTDAIWDEVAKHFDERQLGAIVLAIASINAWNRLNAVTRQITGEWVQQWIAPPGGAAAAKAA